MTESADVEQTPREQYEAALKIVKHLEPLLKSEGWKILEQTFRAQIEARQIANAVPMYKVDDVLHRQLASGEILGLQLAMATAAGMLEEAKAVCEQLKEKVKNE